MPRTSWLSSLSPVAGFLLDVRDGVRGGERIAGRGQPGRTRLHGDGTELVGEDVVQLPGQAGPVQVVRVPGGGGGDVPVGTRDLAQDQRSDRAGRTATAAEWSPRPARSAARVAASPPARAAPASSRAARRISGVP